MHPGFTNEGFPVPMVKGMKFVNPLLALGEVICNDVGELDLLLLPIMYRVM